MASFLSGHGVVVVVVVLVVVAAAAAAAAVVLVVLVILVVLVSVVVFVVVVQQGGASVAGAWSRPGGSSSNPAGEVTGVKLDPRVETSVDAYSTLNQLLMDYIEHVSSSSSSSSKEKEKKRKSIYIAPLYIV